MVIVSMCTESYVDWMFHFLHGLYNNTDDKILINLINFSEKSEKIVKEEFPSVIFRNHKIDAPQKETHNFENKVFKVTYLKGKFIYEAFRKYREPILWIDITALIRHPIKEITDMFSESETLLMRRNFDLDFGKGVYACEIFGMSNEKQIVNYYHNCQKRKTEWFSDQLALCEITGKIGNIKFGEWSNFYYDENAKSWSDRGKTGKGKIEKDDVNWTHNKFCEDLETKFENYTLKFNDFKSKFNKPKILIHTDAKDWCYCNTVKEIIKNPEFDFTVIFDVDKQALEVREWTGDLVWGRCGSYRHKKLLEKRPDLRSISFSTITTGGEQLLNRFSKQIASNQGEAGVIVQNESAKFLVDDWINKTDNGMECFILPNGVDIEKFKPKSVKSTQEYDDSHPVVGFVGRTKESSEREMKGWYFVKFACEMLGLKLKVASNVPGTEVSFDEMPKFYDSIDILMLPSNSEGCSNTLNEAMASGLPVITCRNGFHGENCTDELIFCEREIKSLVDALKSLINPINRESLGKKARKWAESHSWENIQRYYTQTFKSMLLQANKNKKFPSVKNRVAPQEEFISVRAIKKCSFGKLERNGINIWFIPGMTRKIKNNEIYRPIIEQAVLDGFLQILK